MDDVPFTPVTNVDDLGKCARNGQKALLTEQKSGITVRIENFVGVLCVLTFEGGRLQKPVEIWCGVSEVASLAYVLMSDMRN